MGGVPGCCDAPGALPLSLDDGVDMRTMLTIAGIATGVVLTVVVQRHAPHVLWWLFGNGK